MCGNTERALLKSLSEKDFHVIDAHKSMDEIKARFSAKIAALV